ncbi:hypothetical protein AMELA_G00284400 [Ameiurus melas]|uniref:Uncharacterized protein n=1 Tax=Ameiurus melas TaxID=219545 RepID=A0A7J5ZIQ9_AMEME|nr:hypothetical protein AMELA_G00284400 [Ameiurus melas]
MTPLTILALGSVFAGVAGRSVLGRTPESPEAGQCGQLTAPWTETEVPSLSGDWSLMYRLKVFPMSQEGPHRLVFPEQPLFRFVRRVYRCCQMGHHCGGVKGLQGREAAGSTVEFVLSQDVWSVPILRAEVHLHISNPHQLNVQPLLPWLEKRHLPTRYSVWWKDSVLEVRVDLLFLFQALQALRGRRGGSSVMEIRRVGGLHPLRASETRPTEAQGGDGRAVRPLQVPVELGLALHCSTVELNTPLPCESHGVRLLHTPFITLSYG